MHAIELMPTFRLIEVDIEHVYEAAKRMAISIFVGYGMAIILRPVY
jgi:hypothetical protein